MRRRLTLLAVALSLLLVPGCHRDDASPTAPPSLPAVVPSAKKGVGTWYFAGGATAMSDVGVSWYYTWRVDRRWEPAPAGVEFVPMIWDETHANAAELTQAAGTGTGVLLGFNEPDHRQQAEMTVAQALDLWPLLEGTGLRLGSPATAGDPARRGSWLERFMDGARSRSYRVDFVCAHWYGTGTNAAEQTRVLETFLRAIHDKYRKPIWLTEFALVSWTTPPSFPTYDEQAAFVRHAVPMLESLPFVERYAWFSLPPWSADGVPATTNLYEERGAPTPVGAAYSGVALQANEAATAR